MCKGKCEHGKILSIDCDLCKVKRKYEDEYAPWIWGIVENFCKERNMDVKKLIIEHITPLQNHVEFSYRYNHDAVLLVFSKEARTFKLTGWDIILPETESDPSGKSQHEPGAK